MSTIINIGEMVERDNFFTNTKLTEEPPGSGNLILQTTTGMAYVSLSAATQNSRHGHLSMDSSYNSNINQQVDSKMIEKGNRDVTPRGSVAQTNFSTQGEFESHKFQIITNNTWWKN